MTGKTFYLYVLLDVFTEYGPAIIDHVLSECGLAGTLRLVSNTNDKGFNIERDMPALIKALNVAEEMMITASKTISKVHRSISYFYFLCSIH